MEHNRHLRAADFKRTYSSIEKWAKVTKLTGKEKIAFKHMTRYSASFIIAKRPVRSPQGGERGQMKKSDPSIVRGVGSVRLVHF